VATATAVSGVLVYMLVRLVRDASAKPIYEDEALAGLIAAQSLLDVVGTVMVDRGGAPLHFLLAHFALAVEPSVLALRAVSVLFALATVVLCYDLGRRLAGRLAGVTAAIVVATSELLGIYGSFGRMYALFAFAAALAADLFVRALAERTGQAAALAAAAALLLPASHPYGIIPLAAGAVIALVLWRGRPLRPALPALLVLGVGIVPFLVADVRLADRFSVGVAGEPIARRGALEFTAETLRSFAGGSGVAFFLFLTLALAGLALLARRVPAFAAFAALALAAPLLVLLLARTTTGPGPLSPRYLIFLLPLWAALIGVAVAWVSSVLRPVPAAVAIAAVFVLALFAPKDVASDPRVLPAATRDAVRDPAAWIRTRVEENDVLFPYSPVYLAALPEAGQATVISRARSDLLLRGLDRADLPVGKAFLAIPGGEHGLGAGYRVQRFRHWLLLEVSGPFADRTAVLSALYRAVETIEPRDAFVVKARTALRNALCALGEECPPR
jgi:Dolichyl-phosphate-mannose-protein mannosyltransferase